MRIKLTLKANGYSKRVPATSYSMAERIIAGFAFALNVPPQFHKDVLASQGWARSDYCTVDAEWHAEITDTRDR